MNLKIHDTGNNKDFKIEIGNIILSKNIASYELKRSADGRSKLIIEFNILPKEIEEINLKSSILKTELIGKQLRCELLDNRQ